MTADYAQMDRSGWDDYGQALNITLRHAVESVYGPRWDRLLATLEITAEKKVSLVVGVALGVSTPEAQPALTLTAVTLSHEEEAALGNMVSAWEADLRRQGLGLWNYLSFGTSKHSDQSALTVVFAEQMAAQGQNYHQWLASQGLGMMRLYAAHETMVGTLGSGLDGVLDQPVTREEINAAWAGRIQSQLEELLDTEPGWVCAGLVVDARSLLAEPVVRVVAQLAPGGQHIELPLLEVLHEDVVESVTAWRLALLRAGVENWSVTEIFFQNEIPGRIFMAVPESAETGFLPLLDGDRERLVEHYEQLHALAQAEAQAG